ncbi:hypothetical protein [Bacillus pumilus]|uniref:hypothetical protein n=1 Tax=Bacillus pumilus TaxID=1408 RepID=UPI0011A8D87E|nr:hypothetical protein [Bacillus pumilus]
MKLTHEDLRQINSYFNHPNANQISGFVKEHTTGNVYPYTDIFYRDNEPHEIGIIRDNEASVIPYKQVSVVKF